MENLSIINYTEYPWHMAKPVSRAFIPPCNLIPEKRDGGRMLSDQSLQHNIALLLCIASLPDEPVKTGPGMAACAAGTLAFYFNT